MYVYMHIYLNINIQIYIYICIHVKDINGQISSYKEDNIIQQDDTLERKMDLRQKGGHKVSLYAG